MDGIHDLGGMQGFGEVGYSPAEPVFRRRWEAVARALLVVVAGAVKANVLFHTRELSKRSGELKDFVRTGRVWLACGVYSLTTGKVEWLEGPGVKTPPR